MRNFIICLCFISLFLQEIKKQDDNKILWESGVKLAWKDFKGIPREDRGSIKAETYGEIVTVDSYFEDEIPKFKVNCFFLKDKSWTITNNPLSLQHEQIHFDIFEVHTRKIRKAFDSLNQNKIKDLKIYETKFNEIFSKNSSINDRFDDDVQLHRERQVKWITKIHLELKNLKDYE